MTEIKDDAFSGCGSLASVTFKNAIGWYIATNYVAISGTSVTVTNSSTNATNLKSTYCNYFWYRKPFALRKSL